MTFTLADYNELILRPMGLDYIERGTLDNIIFDQELDEIYKNDKRMMNAIKCRRELLLQQNFNQEEI